MKQRHYIKDWIERSGLTVQQVADAIDKDKGTVSKIQNFRQGYTPGTLEGIARALSVPLGMSIEPADLLHPPPAPDDPDAVMRHLFTTLTHAQKLQVIRAVRAMFAQETAPPSPRRKRTAA